MQPPSVFTGSRPPISVSPPATIASCSPSSQKPHSARCMTSAPLSVSCSWATSTSSGATPAAAKAAAAASVLTLEGRPVPWIEGLKTSKEPKRRVRVAAPSRCTARPMRAATASLARTIAAPPSPGEQNMNRVSGSLTMSAAAISSAEIGSRRQAFGFSAPLR